MAMGPVVWKIFGTGGALLAGVLAKKVIDSIWARAEGDEVNPKSPHAPLPKAIAYAMVTGLAAGAAKTLATRKAAQYYEKSAGHLPGDIAEEPV